MSTPIVLSIKATVGAARIMVVDAMELSILLVRQKKRICNSFDGYMIPLYVCLFTRIGL